MVLTFKQYTRKVGAVAAAQVDELTQVAGRDGNLTAHPGDYVVQDGTKIISTWSEKDGAGTASAPTYAVIDRAAFEAEHETT